MKRKQWSVTALLASAGLLASVGVAQEANADAAPAVENNAPSVMGIPGESVNEGGKFADIKLDKYVSDDLDKPEQLKWSVSGNKQLKVSISNDRIATITIPDQYWNGSEDITFMATDTKGAAGSETVTFSVESVNNPPEVSQIPDQTIDEGKTFSKIKLDDYVKDADHPKNQILWEFDIQPVGKDQAEGDLNVEIDPNRVATVIIPDENWYGAAKIKFTATDGEYASDSKTANFVVKPINDPPVVQKIPDQTIEEKNEFDMVNLSDYVSDVDDDVSKIKWTISGNKDLKFEIDKYGSAVIKIPNEFWNGSETVTFTATDPAGAAVSTKATFTVKSVNDAPEFVQEISEQTIDEKQEFKPIELDKLVKDPDHKFEQLKWTISGNKDLKVTVSGKTATIKIPNKLWNGSETIKFKVCDPANACAESENSFTVNSVNDVPQLVKQIPNQSIDEKKTFAKIKLDDFVKDEDHKSSELSWEAEVKHQGKEPESGTLSVNIDESRMASIEIPDTYWNGTAVVTFTVTDPEGASAKQDVTFAVKSINDLPVFKKIPDQSIEEKSEFNSVVLDEYLSDADHDISKLKIEITGNKDIKVNMNAKTREVSFKTPSELWNGSETLTFTATDPEGGKASTQMKLSVKSINDPPVMKDIAEQTIKEKGVFKPVELDKFVEDLDHEKGKLKWTVTGNRELKVAIDGNRVMKVTPPSPQWNGSETLTIKVTDPEGATDERSVAYTVESVNDVPEFVKQVAPQTIKEKAQFQQIKLGEMVRDLDNKLSDLNFSVDVKSTIKGKEAGLTVEIDAQKVATIKIPNKMWNGADEITFTVSDPEGAKATSKALFTVQSVNDVPVLKKIPDQMIDEKMEFASVNLAELASDPDHAFNQLKWTVSGNKQLKIDISKDGTATIKTPSKLWNGSEKVTFTVTDPEGATAKSDAVFTVKSINDAPIMKDIANQTIKEKGEFKPIELDKFVSDEDHDLKNLKWTVSGNKALKVAIDGKHVATVTAPSKNWNGSEQITFTVTDPEGASDKRTVTFTVESVNDLPEFVKPIKDQTIQEKREFAIINLNDIVKDADHKLEQLSWSFDIKPVKGSAKGYTPQLQVSVDDQRMAKIVIPDKNWNGAEEITFKVEDPDGGKASCTAVFTVQSVNDAPTIGKINDQSIKEKEEFKSFNLKELVKDPDHPYEKLKIEVTGQKELKVNVGKDGVVSVRAPTPLWNGTEKLTVTVTDPEGASAKTMATFAVQSINDPPVMKDIANQTIKEKGSFKSIALDNFVEDLDHPKSKLKWKIEGAKELKVAMDASHNVSVTQPNPNWHGKETIKFTVTDPEGASDSRSVTFTVESVNDAPQFVRELKDQSIDEKKQFQTIKLDDLVKDPDHKNGELKWSFDVKPSKAGGAAPAKGKKGKGAVEEKAPAGETLSVKVDKNRVATIAIPNKYWNGAADITFTVTDPEGAKASKTAHYEVRSINDAPVISDKAPKGETIRENGVFRTIDLSMLASDPDHKASQLKWSVSGNKGLKVNMRKDNTVIVSVPDDQWNGKETITFTVTDPEGASDHHKMLFEVTRVNDAPVLKQIPGQKIKEKDHFKPIKLDEFVKDPDNKPNELKWKVSGNKQLKADISPSRILTVSAPNPNFWCAPETIVIMVTDPDGASSSVLANFEITSVNDAPVLKQIPDQKIKEKGQFKEIDLNKFVHDPDHKLSELVWTVKVDKVNAAPAAKPAKKAKKPAKKGKGKKGKEEKEEPEEAAPAAPDGFQVEIDSKNIARVKIDDKYWNGERNVTFTVKDPEGASDSKTVNFKVESVNDAPVIKPIPIHSIQEKEHFKPLDLAQFVSDPDHPFGALKLEVAPARALKASINAKKQLVVSTPNKFWSGSEKIKLDVVDPEGAKATQQITFEVTPVNDPPVVKNIPGQKIKEKEKFEIVDLSKVAEDPDNKPNELHWSVSGNKELKVDIKGTRAQILTPNPNWFGKETLTFTVKDIAGASASAKATFEVTPVNDPPTLKPVQPFVIEEKKAFAPFDFSKVVSDPDNKLEELVWTLDNDVPNAPKGKKGKKAAGGPAVKHEIHFMINEKGLLQAETPNPYWNGTETVTVNVFDPSGEKASVPVKFTVKPVNDSPVVKEIPAQETLQGGSFKPIKLDQYVTDPDNKAHEIRWKVTGAKNLNVQITGGREAVVKPKKADWFGEETLIFTASDPAGAMDKSVVKFTVKHVNAAPIMRDIPDFTIKEDDNNGVIAVIKLDQYARDKDHRFDELKWAFTGNKFLEVKYDKYKKTATVAQPHPHWNGKPERITFTVTDPDGAKASKTALFTVIAVNNPPVAKAQTYMTQEGEELKVSASEGLMSGVMDPDGEKPVAVQLLQKPRNGKINLNERDGSFTYMPNKGFSGLDEFTFKVKDPGGLSSQATTAEVNVSFKMKDLRGNDKKAEPKKEEPKEDDKAPAKGKKKGKKGKRR
ncbi:tandem-95 repeat protein [uncultured Fibrobacter sp.]|uniref:tandem-95 repeat protein n=1 Tax=uncultured Fibrobacter sp. TaxID=261512 RepID=UPI0026385C21|nr:tandem-95 repeat protein [uncultured Fibrobacter sp.]